MKHEIKNGLTGTIESVDGIELNEIVQVQFMHGREKARVVAFQLVLGEPMATVEYCDTDRSRDQIRIDRITTNQGVVDQPDKWEFTPGEDQKSLADLILEPAEGHKPPLELKTEYRTVSYDVEYKYTVTDKITVTIAVPDYLSDGDGVSVAHKIAHKNGANLRGLASEISRSETSVKITPAKG